MPNNRNQNAAAKLTTGIGESLTKQIQERLRKGLSPPAEVYHVQNRAKIDWSQFPEWALPVDPEMFDGCTHEG